MAVIRDGIRINIGNCDTINVDRGNSKIGSGSGDGIDMGYGIRGDRTDELDHNNEKKKLEDDSDDVNTGRAADFIVHISKTVKERK